MFQTILDGQKIAAGSYFMCLITAFICGLVIAITYMKTGEFSKNFVQTLVVMPILVGVVMIMINGSLGTSVAILGAFGLVRFRSMQGSSREISYIFFVMAIGLSTGTGYIFFALLVTAILCVILYMMYQLKFGEKKEVEKELRITIPENLDYVGIFDDIFEKYTKSNRLIRVKTTNLGSMYELCYFVTINNFASEKDMIDEIRCKNGNLNIVCGYREQREEL